jgi:plastocyanin
MSYSPDPASVQVGQQVRWHNADNIAHTATQTGGGFDTGNIPAFGTSAPITFTTAGPINYFCAYHSLMKASLTVTP